MNGLFIVIEGPDGAGTTTHARLLSDRLEQYGAMVVHTCEPTQGTYGQKIRDVLSSKQSMTPEGLQQLFCADRVEHVASVILPSLRDGKVVVCDRYIPSTMVYGEVSGVSRALLSSWNEGFPVPHALIIALPPFEECWKRVSRRMQRDQFEKEAFQRRVYAAYESYAIEHTGCIVVDTSAQKEEASENIWQHVVHLLHDSNPPRRQEGGE